MRQRGFGYIEIAVAIAIAVTLAFAVRWIYSSGVAAGTNKERAAWQKRELVQQQTYADEIAKLRKAKDAELAELQGRLAQADADYQKKKEEADREKTKNARTERDLRDGRIVLVDPGRAGAGEACGGGGTAGAAPSSVGDGQARLQPRGLSGELSAFLWDEAGRADGVITGLVDQLELAQNAVTAYYKIAQSCQKAGTP